MGYAKYVGRVGALAVALGIGTAVTSTTGVAWAASGESDSSTSPGTANDTAKTTTDTPSTSGTPSAGTGASATESKSDAVSDTADPAADAGDATPTSPSASTNEVAPGVVVSSSGGAHTSNDDTAKDDTAEPARESGGKHRKREVTEPGLLQTSSVSQPPGADSSTDPADTPKPAPAPSPQPAADAGPATETLSATSVVAVTAAAEPVVEHVSPTPAVAVLPTETVTTGVVTGLLSTVLGGTSDTPSDSPAEWALLAAARREIGASTETTTTTAAAAAVTTSEVAAPSAMDTIAGAQPQLEVTGSIPAGSSPSGVNVGLLGNKLYITNRDTDTVTVVDRTTGAVIATIAVGDAPSAVDATLTISSPPFSGTSQWIYQAYVANSGSGTVTVLDSTDSVMATVKVGTNPVAVAQSPEGNRVWVVNAGSDSVTKINTVTNTVTTTIKVGSNPSGIAFDTKNAYVTNAGSGTVSVINLTSNKVTTISGVGGSPTGVTVAGGKAYVTNLDGTVAVIDTTAGTVTSHITVPAPANSAVLSSDGARLLVAGTDGTVSAIDIATNTVVQTLQTDPTPDSGAPVIVRDGDTYYLTDDTDSVVRVIAYATVTPPANSPPQVGLPVVGAPDTDTGLVTGSLPASDPDGDSLQYTVSDKPDLGSVAFDSLTGTFAYTPTDAARLAAGQTLGPDTDTFTFRVSDGKLAVDVPVTVTIAPSQLVSGSTANVGPDPAGVAVSADGSRAYVTNRTANTVSVVDTATNTVISTIAVGSSPAAIALLPNGTRAYVTNSGAGTVSVVDTATNTVVATVKVGLNPTGITVNADGTRVWVANSGANTITKINTATNIATATLKISNSATLTNPVDIALSTDGRYAYVALQNSNAIAVITLATNTVSTFGAGTSPVSVTAGTNSLEMVYVTGLDGTVTVLYPSGSSVRASVATSGPATSAALSADGSTLLVTHTNGSVTAIDANTNAVIATLQSDPTPGASAAAVVAVGNTFYFTDSADGALRTVSIQAGSGGPTLPVNHAPQVGEPVTGIPATGTGLVNGSIVATDADGDALSYSVISGPSRGSIALDSASGTFVYAPTTSVRLAAGQAAIIDHFTVAVTDGTATVEKVVPVTIAPAHLGTGTDAATGTTPTGVAVLGGKAYVVNSGEDTVSVIDTATHTVTATIAVGSAPSSIAMSPDGSRAYVTNNSAGTVSVISTATNAVLATVKVGAKPVGVTVSADGARVWVANSGSGTITKINTTTNLVTTTVTVGGAPQAVALSADGKYAYVAKNTTNDVAVITVQSNAVKTITDVGVSPVSVILGGGGKGYVTNLDGTIAVLGTALNVVTGVITTPAPAVAAALSADGTVLLVAHPNDTVTAIDTATNTVIGILQTDPSPESTGTPGLTVVGNTFYLTDSTDNVLRTVTFQDVAATL